MPNEQKHLYMYEALELRAEYDARRKTLNDTLPENFKVSKRRSMFGSEQESFQPSPDYKLNEVKEAIRKLDYKYRKLNSAIQKANYNYQLIFEDEAINLSEALEIRKSLNKKIGELHDRTVAASHLRTIHKEERDIVEESEISYQEAVSELNDARIAFRVLNRFIRKASYEIAIDYQDE
ncbi:hypothetical protein KJ966_18220 [bacterium]|nr:hypothetical protein [bacterium]